MNAHPHLRLVPRPGLAKARARTLAARLGAHITELGRMADEAADEAEVFAEIASAAGALARARQKLDAR